MAAYSAVVSLEQLLKQLLDSDQFPLHYPKPQIQSLHDKVCSLKFSVEKIFPAPKSERSVASDLEILIRDEIYKSLDIIESFIFRQSLTSESQEIPGDPSISLEEIRASIDPLTEKAEELASSIGHAKDDVPAANISQPSIFTSSSRSTRIVGQDGDKKRLMAELLNEDDELLVIPISGMAGIGKTTLARSIYDDSNIKNQFPFRAWVTVSQDYNVGEVLAKLLNSMESRGQKAGEKVFQGSDEQLRVQLHQSLYNNRYLIVIDDMWDSNVWDQIRNSLPDNKNQSRVLLTTRMLNVAKSVRSSWFYHEMKPLGEEDSWMLLCERIFGGPYCPPHLVKIGRKIAKNCSGFPLALTAVGGLLSGERKTEEYWQIIEEDTNAAAAQSADYYSDILSLSYNHLPGKLKGCFLYMAAFPQDCEISVSRLIKLWVAEGFLTPPLPPQTIEQVAEESLAELIDRNLIVVRSNSSDGRIKTCGMYNSLRELAEKESRKEKFLHPIKNYVEKLEEGAETQRRVSVHETNLMCQKQVYQSAKSIELARSLLYVGPYYCYPLPFCLTFGLLRVFDALTVFFIEFPYEVIKLIHLRYLSLTYNGELPSSLSKLQNLQILMVRRQPKIIFVGISFLPEEIWEMPQLRHLLFTESELPLPSGAKFPGQNSVLLANLQSLSNVSAVSCTREALQNMPNLKKLGMWIDEPTDVGFYLDELKLLEAFKFTVLKPIPRKKINFQPELFFPETLRKLSLSGCGLPWEDMRVIGELPNLEVLKLRELAFHGDEWYVEDYTFMKLKFLLLEYLNLKYWRADDSSFPLLQRLIIRHCYELEGVPSDIGYIGYLELIELVDCSPDAVYAAEEIREEQESFGNERLQVRIYSSWE